MGNADPTAQSRPDKLSKIAFLDGIIKDGKVHVALMLLFLELKGVAIAGRQ